MDRSRVVLVVGCAGMIGFALAFAYPAYSAVRVLWYYPLEHRWAFEVAPRGLAMDWYGRCLLASAVGLAAMALTFPLARFVRKVSDGTYLTFTGWALTATLMVMGFYAWSLANREPRPEPLPSDYEAR
jgi:hypothetical protein